MASEASKIREGVVKAGFCSSYTHLAERAIHARAYILVNNSAGDSVLPNGNVLNYPSGAMVLDPLGQVVERTMQNDRSEKMIIVKLKRPVSNFLNKFEVRKDVLRKAIRAKNSKLKE